MTCWYISEFNTWLEKNCPEDNEVDKINLEDTKLTLIPSEIGKLQNLYGLWLEKNILTFIPPEIGKLQNLKYLFLQCNLLTHLPKEIGQLKNLTHLYLNNNNLTFLPEEIFECRNLVYLDLKYNELQSISPKISQLQRLNDLCIENNKLTSIPPDIGKLKNLSNLLLFQNEISLIPPEFGKLENLRVLSFCSNRLTFIPAEIGQLKNLTTFSLSCNRLTSIPPEIGQLENLLHFYIDSNLLTSIPPEIGLCRNLHELAVDNNPIEYIPVNIFWLLERQKSISQRIYDDTQSVHNSSIQKSLKESIFRLLKEKIVEKNIISLILSDSVLTTFTKESLIEYSKDESIHSELNITFSDLLLVVWNRILVSPYFEEIKNVLNTEMTDAACKCFTGRISRLVNCLNGFDPLVQIQISDNEQIGNIISLIKNQLIEKNEYTVEKHKQIAQERLQELKVNDFEINIWLSYIE